MKIKILLNDYAAPVKLLSVARNEKVTLSASLDGIVKAHDLLRHHYFRSFGTPTQCQISSLAANPSSSIF